MGDPVKQSEGRKVHPVGWEADEWARLLEAARVMSAQQHLDLGPTDVIRSGTRRFVDELLGRVEAERAAP